MLENLIGQLYQTNTQLPLQYGQMNNQAFAPYYSYLQSQAGNAANLGGQNINAQASLGNQYIGNAGQLGSSAMGLYGTLAGQEAGMYQSELPMQMEMAKYNSLSPVLAGLLGQGGMGGFNISPISMDFNRPNVMRGYGRTVGNSYDQLGRAYGTGSAAANDAYGQGMQGMQGYDETMGGAFADNLDRLPSAPGRPMAGMPQQEPQAAGGGDLTPAGMKMWNSQQKLNRTRRT
jgi:hypothetical protein